MSHKNGMIVGAALCVASLVFLFAVFPHSAGYNERASLFVRVRGLWQAGGGAWIHGMFVVPVLACLIFWDRKQFAALPIKPANVGIIAVVLSLFLYWIGYKANVHYFGFAAIHLLVVGLVLWILGWQWFKALFFHVCFLAFMWPIIFLDEELAVPLRYMMVEMSSGLLTAVGVENLRVGTAIVSAADPANGIEQGARFQLDVANPCSGIRSLFALMMISALYGFVTLKGFWKRSFLFLCSLPLAVAGNVARILMLAFGSAWFGADFAIGESGSESSYHILSGFVVFIVALAGLVAIGGMLKHGMRRTFGRSVTVVSKQTQEVVE